MNRFTWRRRGLGGLALALGLAGLGWFLAGCVPTSVHPLYRAADVIHEPALLGVWRDKPDGKEQWSFTAGSGKSYSVEIHTDDQKAVFVGHLFKIGDERFLDLYPSLSALEDRLEKDTFGMALIPGHLFFRVLATAPNLRMSTMDLDWLKKELKSNPKSIGHILVSEDRVVLTSETAALQEFLKRHLATAEAWNAMYEDGLVRIQKPDAK